MWEANISGMSKIPYCLQFHFIAGLSSFLSVSKLTVTMINVVYLQKKPDFAKSFSKEHRLQ